MAPLVVLLVTYVLALRACRNRRDPTLPGRIALAAMLILTGVSHFTSTDALVAMVPPMLPSPVALVYATGVLELAFAVALVLRPSPALGWTLVAFLLAVLPANIYSAVNAVGLGGHGAGYLWFRIPLQLYFIAWAAVHTRAVRVRRRTM